ncbi:helix-turn-helix domain-containing protein [uncultured Treponema sp.]|uniref:helix-turn-helix domain-containing protein n=1 Tax=uncultured Treponema sp. TaxID=162155 RepID=UPI0025F45ECC|nr:helix-turn-helix transcriptional regulator [uncultured Treponema sp.]
MKIREIFRQNLRYYRKKCGLTQEALSERIGLNPKYITNIEAQSKFPSAETIDAIAEALNIKSSQLFVEQGCPVNVVQFDKDIFMESLVAGISSELKAEVVKYFDKIF